MRRVLALLACGLVIGCGPDSADSGEEEYRSVVERMCREAERDGEQRAKRSESPREFFRWMLEYSRRTQARYEELDPPSELAKEHERSEELGREAIVILEDLVEALERGDDNRSLLRRKFRPLLAIMDESNELAREMDLDDCVVPPLVPERNSPGPS